MGTRHLIICKVNKKVKVAQYGQWDGYLSGQGIKIAEFIQDNLSDSFSMDYFIRKLNTIEFFSETELKKIDSFADEMLKKGLAYPPQLSRNTGADILEIINNIDQPTFKLVNSEAFGEDDVFCEYSYVLDFDSKNLEIYTGGPKKKNLFKKLKFSKVTSDKILSLEKTLNKNRE